MANVIRGGAVGPVGGEAFRQSVSQAQTNAAQLQQLARDIEAKRQARFEAGKSGYESMLANVAGDETLLARTNPDAVVAYYTPLIGRRAATRKAMEMSAGELTPAGQDALMQMQILSGELELPGTYSEQLREAVDTNNPEDLRAFVEQRRSELGREDITDEQRALMQSDLDIGERFLSNFDETGGFYSTPQEDISNPIIRRQAAQAGLSPRDYMEAWRMEGQRGFGLNEETPDMLRRRQQGAAPGYVYKPGESGIVKDQSTLTPEMMAAAQLSRYQYDPQAYGTNPNPYQQVAPPPWLYNNVPWAGQMPVQAGGDVPINVPARFAGAIPIIMSALGAMQEQGNQMQNKYDQQNAQNQTGPVGPGASGGMNALSQMAYQNVPGAPQMVSGFENTPKMDSVPKPDALQKYEDVTGDVHRPTMVGDKEAIMNPAATQAFAPILNAMNQAVPNPFANMAPPGVPMTEDQMQQAQWNAYPTGRMPVAASGQIGQGVQYVPSRQTGGYALPGGVPYSPEALGTAPQPFGRPAATAAVPSSGQALREAHASDPYFLPQTEVDALGNTQGDRYRALHAWATTGTIPEGTRRGTLRWIERLGGTRERLDALNSIVEESGFMESAETRQGSDVGSQGASVAAEAMSSLPSNAYTDMTPPEGVEYVPSMQVTALKDQGWTVDDTTDLRYRGLPNYTDPDFVAMRRPQDQYENPIGPQNMPAGYEAPAEAPNVTETLDTPTPSTPQERGRAAVQATPAQRWLSRNRARGALGDMRASERVANMLFPNGFDRADMTGEAGDVARANEQLDEARRQWDEKMVLEWDQWNTEKGIIAASQEARSAYAAWAEQNPEAWDQVQAVQSHLQGVYDNLLSQNDGNVEAALEAYSQLLGEDDALRAQANEMNMIHSMVLGSDYVNLWEVEENNPRGIAKGWIGFMNLLNPQWGANALARYRQRNPGAAVETPVPLNPLSAGSAGGVQTDAERAASLDRGLGIYPGR